MNKRVIIIYSTLSILFLAITLGCVYYLLGGIVPGVNDLRVYEQDGLIRHVAGLGYEGKPKSKEAVLLFEKYRNWVKKDIENSKVKDQIMKLGEVDNSRRQFNYLSVLNYETDSDKRVKQFVGVAIRGLSGELPMGDEEVIEVACEKRYTVFLTMKAIVRPSVSKIEEMIRAEAVKYNQKIAFYYLTYYPDNSMRIEGFVK